MQELRPFDYDALNEDPVLKYCGRRVVPVTKGLRIAEPVNNPGLLGGVMLSVHFETKTTHHVLGSAVLVAPGIALSARHVFMDHPSHPSDFEEIVAIGHHESESFLWLVDAFAKIDNTDLAILSLRLLSAPPKSGVIPVAQITDRTPAIGEELFVAGFRATDEIAIVDGYRNITGDVYCCSGPLLRIFPERRDSSMITFPCYEVDCAAPGRVSGGPVFDADGRLCAIYSSSYSEGPAYVSMLWPALDLPFGCISSDGFLRSEQTLRDFMEYQKRVDDSNA